MPDTSEYMIAKDFHELTDKQALLRAESDLEAARSIKANGITRGARYLNIYKALNSPTEMIDETTGMIAEDESRYSNTYLPIGAAVVDSAVAQMYNMLFSINGFMEIDVDDLEDSFFAEIVTGHLYKRLEEMKFKHKVVHALQMCSTFDYAITLSRWLLEGGYQPTVNTKFEEFEIGGVKFRDQRRVSGMEWKVDKIDRSDMQVLQFDQCFPDPDASDGFNDSRFFCDERDVPLWELIRLSKGHQPFGKYKNVDKVVAQFLEQRGDDIDRQADPDKKRAMVQNYKVKVKRYWTQHHVMEWASDWVLHRMNIHDWPLRLWQIFNLTGEFGGMGFLQRMERNQLDINAALNANRNLANLISNPFAIADQELFDATAGEPEIYPGWVGISKGGAAKDKLWVYTPGQNTNMSTMMDVNMEIGMVERMAGISQAMQGETAGGRTTAHEIGEVAAGAHARVDKYTERIEDDCLVPHYLDFFFLEQAYLTNEQSFKYNAEHAEQFFTVNPVDYMWNSIPRFRARGTSYALKSAVDTAQFLKAIELGMALPNPQEIDWHNIKIELFRRLTPKEYWKFVKDRNAPQANYDPEMENYLMSIGHRIEVSEANDPAQHIAVHQSIIRTPDYQTWPAQYRANHEEHLQQHQQAGQQPQQIGPTQDQSDPLRGQRLQ